MSTPLQEEALKQLGEYEKFIHGNGDLPAQAVKAIANCGMPFLGYICEFIVTKVIGPPPEILAYMEELRKVIRGERHTMPEVPRFSMKDFGR